MVELPPVFNVAFPFAVAGAALCYAIMAGVLNAISRDQDILSLQRLNAALSGFALIAHAAITADDFREKLRNQQADITTIPDFIRSACIQQTWVFAGNVMSLILLFVAVLFEYGVQTQL
jgi:hypothetical protein